VSRGTLDTQQVVESAAALADAEGLDAHAQSMRIRIEAGEEKDG